MKTLTYSKRLKLKLIQLKQVSNNARYELNGVRLQALRDLEGLSQTALASELEVSQSFLSHIEKGNKPLPETLAHSICIKFGLPLSFFTVQPNLSGQFTFRKKMRASVRDERRIKQLHDEAARLFKVASEESSYKFFRWEDYGPLSDPEIAAEHIRGYFGISPQGAVPNVVRLIERMGIGVITDLDKYHSSVSDHAGISRPSESENRPIVALVDQERGDVQRMSLGHELGHLLFDRGLHNPIKSSRSNEEKRAFRFAGALLLPASEARLNITESLPLHGYLPIKANFGLSVGALIYRARDLGLISSDRHRSLAIQLSSQGWRKNEPVEVRAEEPKLLTQALERAYGSAFIYPASEATGVQRNLITRWSMSSGAASEKFEEYGDVISLDSWKSSRSKG